MNCNSNFKGPLLKRARTRALLHAAKENGRRRPSTEIGVQTYCGNSVDHRSNQKPSVPSLTFSPPCAAFLGVVFRRYEGCCCEGPMVSGSASVVAERRKFERQSFQPCAESRRHRCSGPSGSDRTVRSDTRAMPQSVG
jgi:hypothetical protein